MSKSAKSWKDLEIIVRLIASHLFNREANARTINGIKCDAVLEIEKDHVVLIEITKSSSLEKLRTDLAKFATLKPYYMLKNIYAKCFFICDVDIHPSLIETANGLNIEAMSARQFSEKLFNHRNYQYARTNKSFGSAVDPITGYDDKTEYTPVTYTLKTAGETNIQDIVQMLIDGKFLVLIGEYGSGKSRCLKELFKFLSEKTNEFFKFPIHINLRENWGLKRSNEILSRHLSDLGLSNYLDSLIKIYDKPSICYLLDGFDEVGAQTWSDSPEKLKEIRKQSLLGVKDIIINSKGGCIITGREHYFKSDDELINCLGLEKKNPIFITCKPEFSDEEVKYYLRGKSNIQKLPEWLPKKPLLCQIIKEIEISDLDLLFRHDLGEFDFFDSFLDLIADRETRINNALDKEVVKEVLLRLSVLARTKEKRYGPITINDLNTIFENITGNTVADETAIFLQRLPGLGRIDGASHDRQFVDEYLLSGLQALSTLNIINSNDKKIAQTKWKNSLSEWSLRYLSSTYENSVIKTNCIYYITSNYNHNNKYIIGDLVSSLSIVDDGYVDFNNIILENCHFPVLNLTNNSIGNVTFNEGLICRLIIEDTSSKDILIKNVCIELIEGISSVEGCPTWFQDNEIESFQELNTISQIKKSKLNGSQKLFIMLTRKLFMQPGAGRKENALFKGYDSAEQKKEVNKILQILLQYDFYEIAPGHEGKLYVPNRKMNARILKIHNELSLSKDEVWLKVTNLGKKLGKK